MAHHIDRRTFLKVALSAPAVLSAAKAPAAQSLRRVFEVRVRVEIARGEARTAVWLPILLTRPSSFQRTIDQKWSSNGQRVAFVIDPTTRTSMLAAHWPSRAEAPVLELTMTVATTAHAVPLVPRNALPSPSNLRAYLQPTALIPVDGIVRDTGLKITLSHATPLTKARALYDWIVENTFRDPTVQGCGLGDIRWMLESGNLGGKCADLNALFVGLCRSVGLPARDLYGLRVGASARFKSLGRSGEVNTAQHCRAEVYVESIGWIPVDPADVRKVVLEEGAGLTLEDEDVRRARTLMFGAWEMNWIAFNDTHDVSLPGSAGKPLPYFMYPQAEVGGVRRDPLDAGRFRYTITSREVAGAPSL
jgi:transglutaminase-like putative cysteine protease